MNLFWKGVQKRVGPSPLTNSHPYLIGEDPRRVVHHWQAMYRHAFYRGGPILTSALSGVEQALWDLAGEIARRSCLSTLRRTDARPHQTLQRAAEIQTVYKEWIDKGFTAFKTGVRRRQDPHVSSKTKPSLTEPGESLRSPSVKPQAQKLISQSTFTGLSARQTAKVLIKALEPYQPMFVEEPIQCQNVDTLAEIARSTHLPIATGERVFTKWGFREILEKQAASILQPDLCHAGGINEVRIIAGMAEAYYGGIAPHNPLGPISLAACIQLDASIPNFVMQEHTTLGEGYLKNPFVFKDGFVELPTGPGLGIELDEDALEDKIDHDWQNPTSYHPDDGSVVDW